MAAYSGSTGTECAVAFKCCDVPIGGNPHDPRNGTVDGKHDETAYPFYRDAGLVPYA